GRAGAPGPGGCREAAGTPAGARRRCGRFARRFLRAWAPPRRGYCGPLTLPPDGRAGAARPIGEDETVTDDALRLRPMTAAEFGAWLPRQLSGYAALIVASGAMPAAAARHKAEADTARMFPRGAE